MKRFLASAATAALIASPLAAFAAPTAGELLSQIAMTTAPTTSSMELHGHAEGVYFAVWASGSQQGKWMDADAKAKWKATIDVVQGSMSMRAKVQLRMFENTVYVKIDAMEGDLGELMSWNLLQNTWVKMPLEDGVMMMDAPTPMLQMMLDDPSMRAMIDEMFTMTEARFPGGKAYKLTPNANFLAQMDAPQGANVDMEIRVNTTNDWIFSYAAVDMEMSDPTGMTMTLHAETQRTDGNVYVEVPMDALTWQEFEAKMGGMFGADMMMPDMPMPEDWPEDEWVDEEWTDDEWMEDEWLPGMDSKADEYWSDDWADEEILERPTWIYTCDAEPGTPDYLLQMRKGFCPMTGPMRGSRDERYGH